MAGQTLRNTSPLPTQCTLGTPRVSGLNPFLTIHEYLCHRPGEFLQEKPKLNRTEHKTLQQMT